MRSYLDLMKQTLEEGTLCVNERTHHSTFRLVGPQLEFWVNKGFPIVTTRTIVFDKVATELDWFLQGNTNTDYLKKRNNHIWDAWALSPQEVYQCQNRDKYGNRVEVGECGPIYGAQWTRWKTSRGVCLNQLNQLLDGLKKHPFSRRHIVSAWNPEYLPDESLTPQQNVLLGNQCLAPCHTMFQVFIEPAPLWARLLDEGPEAYKNYVTMFHDYFAPVHQSIREYYEGPLNHWWKNTVRKKSYANDSYLEEVTDMAFKDGIFSPEWEMKLKRHIKSEDLFRLHQIINDVSRHPSSRAHILHLKMYARSQDLPIGTAFNISSYALLLSLLAHELNHIPGKYIHTIGDAHIYTNQLEKLKIQLERVPEDLPTLVIENVEGEPEEKEEWYFKSPLMKGKRFKLIGYDSHPPLTYPIAI